MTVKVKHLIQFLETLDKNTEVWLDHDGWMENRMKPKARSGLDIVKQRGIFDIYKKQKDKKTVLIINN